MPDSILSSLATWAEYILDENTMRRWVGVGWPGIPRYSGEILEILKRGQAMRPDIGEVFDEWRRQNDIKRGRIEASSNKDTVDFMERRERWLADQGFGPGTKRKVRAARKGEKGGMTKQPGKLRGVPTPRRPSLSKQAGKAGDHGALLPLTGSAVPVTPRQPHTTKDSLLEVLSAARGTKRHGVGRQ